MITDFWKIIYRKNAGIEYLEFGGAKPNPTLAHAKEGIGKTVDFFKSIGMPVSLRGLGIEPSDEELQALSLDATMNGKLKLSRIRPLDTSDVCRIYRNAVG